MFQWFLKLFMPTQSPDIAQSMVVMMMGVALGVFFGRIKFKSVSLGVSAVMFVSLILGHLGYRMHEQVLHFIRDFGLILFVYGIGIQVGPSFFSSFKKEGLVFNILAVSTVLAGGGIAAILFSSTNLGIENVVGIMSGSVTNTPGLGAAKNTITELTGNMGDRVFVDPAIAYAITYPLGVFGIIGVIIFFKSVLKIDLDDEMRKYRMSKINSSEPIVHKKIRVTKDEIVGKSLNNLLMEFEEGKIVVTKQKHSGTDEVFSPTLDTRIQKRDVLMVEGRESDISNLVKKIGRVSTDQMIESDRDIQSEKFYVTNAKIIHKTLAELELYNKYDLKVTTVLRAGRQIIARPSLELFYGDCLTVVGAAESLDIAEELLGNSEKHLEEPDFFSLFGGLLLGIIIGSIPIFIPTLPIPIKLGFAAGPLIVALLISRYGGIGLIHSYINNGAIYFMKDFGIALFFAAVGIHAGEGFYENFVKYNGWMMMFYGTFITFIPLIAMFVVARWYLKINFLQLAGIMSGSYTDPAALSFSTNYLNSDIPITSYATVYPLVTIARIFVAQLLILLFI